MFLILDMFLHRVAILSPRFACAILRGKSIRQRKVCGHLNRLLAEPIWHIRVLTAPIGMNMTLNNQSTNQVFDHLLGSYLLAYENGCVCVFVCLHVHANLCVLTLHSCSKEIKTAVDWQSDS